MGLHHDNLVEGHDAEGRVANVLLSAERQVLSLEEAVGALRWAARNWLKARRGLVNAAKLTLDPDVQRAIAEGLEVDDED